MVFSEDRAEMTGIVIAQLLSDIGDGTLRMVQEMFRLFHFFLGDDLENVLPVYFLMIRLK